MPRTFRAQVLFLDGVPDSSGELFAFGAINNLNTEVALKDDIGRVIGTAKVTRGNEGEEGLYVEAAITDDGFPAGHHVPSIAAVGYDCDHRYENGKSVAIRINEADLMHVILGAKNMDSRIQPVDVPAAPPVKPMMYIDGIRRRKRDGDIFIYADLREPDGALAISATLDYILDEIQEHGYEVRGVRAKKSSG